MRHVCDSHFEQYTEKIGSTFVFKVKTESIALSYRHPLHNLPDAIQQFLRCYRRFRRDGLLRETKITHQAFIQCHGFTWLVFNPKQERDESSQIINFNRTIDPLKHLGHNSCKRELMNVFVCKSGAEKRVEIILHLAHLPLGSRQSRHTSPDGKTAHDFII